MDWIIFFTFITKSTNANGILSGNFMSLKSILFEKSLSAIVTLAKLQSAGFKYLTEHHLKHSLSLIFWILIKTFLGYPNCFDNLI